MLLTFIVNFTRKGGFDFLDYFQTYKSDSTNAIYSLDMVRLNIDFGTHLDEFTKYLQHIADYDLRYEITDYQSFKPFKYRHLWAIKDTKTEYSWSIGLDLGRNTDDRSKGFIEFNPNKCENSVPFNEFWERFSLFCPFRQLVRYDLAIDLPFRRSQCRLKKEGGKNYELFSSDDGLTEYLGCRSHGGFVKLYDKTIESKLDYELTRLEITLDMNDDFLSKFPTVWVYDPQYNLNLVYADLKSTDKVIISLLREVPEPMFYFNQLSYHMRKKIEPYLADKVLSPDNKCWLSVRSLALSYTTL